MVRAAWTGPLVSSLHCPYPAPGLLRRPGKRPGFRRPPLRELSEQWVCVSPGMLSCARLDHACGVVCVPSVSTMAEGLPRVLMGAACVCLVDSCCVCGVCLCACGEHCVLGPVCVSLVTL